MTCRSWSKTVLSLRPMSLARSLPRRPLQSKRNGTNLSNSSSTRSESPCLRARLLTRTKASSSNWCQKSTSGRSKGSRIIVRYQFTSQIKWTSSTLAQAQCHSVSRQQALSDYLTKEVICCRPSLSCPKSNLSRSSGTWVTIRKS